MWVAFIFPAAFVDGTGYYFSYRDLGEQCQCFPTYIILRPTAGTAGPRSMEGKHDIKWRDIQGGIISIWGAGVGRPTRKF